MPTKECFSATAKSALKPAGSRSSDGRQPMRQTTLRTADVERRAIQARRPAWPHDEATASANGQRDLTFLPFFQGRGEAPRANGLAMPCRD